MFAPLIGITSENTENQYGQPAVLALRTYVREVIKAGGIPVIIPTETTGERLEALFMRLDGIILTGGDDIDPARYNGEAHPKIGIPDLVRDECEITLARLAVEKQKPILGICRGIQLLNVALGGDLYTHVEDQHPAKMKHDYYPEPPRDIISHPVIIAENSKLHKIIGEREIPVNSLHHQGIKTLARQLVASAHAPDGLIEAAEVRGHPFAIAVQWHPEWIPEQPTSQALFKAFIEAASNKQRA